MLETFAQLLGATGLIIGVYYLLNKQLIEKVRLPGLSRKQAFALIITLLVLVWSLVVLVILSESNIVWTGNGSTVIQGTEGSSIETNSP